MGLVESARQLSAGTISACTGEKDYQKIDWIRISFVQFCKVNNGYVSWVCAWHDFKRTLKGKL